MKELNAVEICVRLRAALLIKEKVMMKVHSVFASAINVIDISCDGMPTNVENLGHECISSEAEGDDTFFTLLSDRRSLYPMSCRVSSDIPFTEYGIREGLEVIVSGNKILIPEANFSINLKDSVERDLSFDKVEGLLVPKDFGLKVDALKELIQEKGCEYDLSTLVTGKYQNPFADLIRKRLPELNYIIKLSTKQIRNLTGDLAENLVVELASKPTTERARELTSSLEVKQLIEQAGELAGRLAGCGIGLTPSSDDMLVGYMSAYLADSKAKGCSSAETYKITYEMGNKASKHTNTISGAFLKQCGRGLLSEDMTNLMCALYSNSKVDTIRKYGQRIQNFGSTSGTDMLTGVVLAVINLNF